MKSRSWKRAATPAGAALLAIVGATGALAQEPKVEVPQPMVPEVFTLEGEFVRVAYNNEGYATLGYRLANASVGEEWMLLEVGVTLRRGVDKQKLARGAFTLDTPGPVGIQLATQEEFAQANLQALDMRLKMITRDSIDYFPPDAREPCRLGFFTDMGTQRGLTHDVMELSPQTRCIGRIYFRVPDGIQHGQHFLNVKFAKSLVRVPFRILTEEEEKLLRGKWKDIKKEHEKTFRN